MRPSTLVELAGFGLITYATYTWNQVIGLVVGGVFLLLIGYGTNDEAITRPIGSAISAVIRWRPRRKTPGIRPSS